MKQALARWPNYAARFGIAEGTRLVFAVERDLPARSEAVRSYRVPGIPSPVWLRETVADHATFWQNLVLRQYDIDRFPHAARLDEAYRGALAAGRVPVIVDCGANIGLSVLWFAARFPQARIVAVEPDEANHALLERNTRPLGDRVRLVKGGVWPRSDWLRISNPAAGAAAFRVESCAEGTPGALRAYSVPELHALGGGGELLVVKIDIEGSQRQLFDSGTDWVGQAHLVTLELDDWQFPWTGSSRSFFACMSRWPYEYLLGGESVFCFRDTHAA